MIENNPYSVLGITGNSLSLVSLFFFTCGNLLTFRIGMYYSAWMLWVQLKEKRERRKYVCRNIFSFFLKTQRTIICLFTVYTINMKESAQHWNLIIFICFHYQTVNITRSSALILIHLNWFLYEKNDITNIEKLQNKEIQVSFS
jgi:hypothetical protein